MANSRPRTEDLEVDLVSRYLLGELSGEQLTLVEERYFTEPSFLRLVETVEDDLIDAYVRNEMPPPKRRLFEHHFLASPGRRERMWQANALLQRLTERDSASDASPPPALLPAAASQRPVAFRPAPFRTLFGLPSADPFQTSELPGGKRGRLIPRAAARIAAAAARAPARMATAAVLVAMLAACVILFFQNAALRRENNELRAEQQDLIREFGELERELAALSGTTPPDGDQVKPGGGTTGTDTASLIASFTLTPGNARGEGLKEIRFPGTSTMIRFDLPIDYPPDSKTARAVLTRAGGAEIWSRGRLPIRRARGTEVVSVLVSARLLQAGEYQLTLIAEDDSSGDVIADYPFRVISR
jgi:hypothetical protein